LEEISINFNEITLVARAPRGQYRLKLTWFSTQEPKFKVQIALEISSF